ncbi:MAG TPA: tetratricopeptide repeat protein [Candidatus Eisenbacteria bacterium]|nr:tetratricopeptide repeat protein [Candidatus Eisenbacteria bacterium]
MAWIGGARRDDAEAGDWGGDETIELTAAPLHRSRPLGETAALVLVLVAALLPYLNSLAGEFVFDDIALVLQNPNRTPGMGLFDWFTRVTAPGPVYRPLPMVTFALNAMYGASPVGYHVVNVALHVAASAAAFDLGLLLAGSTSVALLAGLLFAVHPVHTEAVSNIAGRPEILAGLFSLLALSSFVRARREGATWLWDAVACVALAAGMFSKENAFTVLPLLVLVYAWIRPADRHWLVLAPYVVVAAACLAVRHAVVGSLVLAALPPHIDNPLAHVSTLERLRTAAVILQDYLAVLALPMRLSADEGFNQVPVVESWGDPRFLAAMAVLGAVAAGIYVAVRKRRGVVVVGALFGAIALSLTANVLFPIGTNKAERLLYLPSFGWCLAIGWLAATWAEESRARLRVVVVVLLLFAARTCVRNLDWRTNFTFFTATAEASPGSARANKNAGSVYAMTGNWEAAREHYARALDIDPTYALAALGLGGVAAAQGAAREAATWYAKAATLDPTLVVAHLYLGQTLLQTGDLRGAEAAYRTGVAASPGEPQLVLGFLGARAAQDDAEARRLAEDMQRLRPGSPEMADAVAKARLRYTLP